MEHMEISKLISQRGNLKLHLTRSENCLKNINLDTDLESLDLEERLKAHLTLFDKFNNIQNEIEYLSKSDLEFIEAQESERVQFEQRFYAISGLLKKYLKKNE